MEVVPTLSSRLKLIQQFGDRSAECRLRTINNRPRGISVVVTATVSFVDDHAVAADDLPSDRKSTEPPTTCQILGQTIRTVLSAAAIQKLVGLAVSSNVQLENVRYQLPTSIQNYSILVDISEYTVTLTMPYCMTFNQLRQYIRYDDFDATAMYATPKRLSVELRSNDIFKGVDVLYDIVRQYAATNESIRSFLAVCRSEDVPVAYQAQDKSSDITDLLLDDCQKPLKNSTDRPPPEICEPF